MPQFSIVITTRNEERNIGNCLSSLTTQTFQDFEVIVIDNASTDRTKAIAAEHGARVYNWGPERSAQRNYGIIQKALGEKILFLDADMVLSPRLLEHANQALTESVVGLYIEEVIIGCSRYANLRRFERSFYSGSDIDCVRVFRRTDFIHIGGFDESLTGPEDWDLDRRLRQLGMCVILPSILDPLEINPCSIDAISKYPTYIGLFHNELGTSIRTQAAKKSYYFEGITRYRQKWGRGDSIVRRQLGAIHRVLGIFLSRNNYRKVAHHPIKFAALFCLRLWIVVLVLLQTRKLICSGSISKSG